jgi:LacI family transcriptional regulator
VRKAPTIRDVAKQAGVSVAVVSRVLNDGTGPVAAATRERVVAVMEDLAYRPRAAARELSQTRADTIGLLLADLANPFFARLADRIVWEARARGVQVVLMTTQEDPHLEAQSLETMLGRSVGGVIATPTGGNLEGWQRLRRVGIEVVFVDRAIPDFDVDLVSIRNVVSAKQATNYLLDLGHRRIGFISGPLSTSTGSARVEGYRNALRERGVEFDPALVQQVPFRGESGGDAAGALWALADRPTAMIVANTAQVRNALRRLSQSGVSIPDELSVIVFDDNPWTELVSPPLTAVRQPIDMLAMHSVELVLARMQGKYSSTPRTIEVESEFVERSSCAILAR